MLHPTDHYYIKCDRLSVFIISLTRVPKNLTISTYPGILSRPLVGDQRRTLGLSSLNRVPCVP